jgi:hypothetical protein|eukprot:COSAG02_NODE_2751_length_8098_cov_4.799600_4_plen_283_part_00
MNEKETFFFYPSRNLINCGFVFTSENLTLLFIRSNVKLIILRSQNSGLSSVDQHQSVGKLHYTQYTVAFQNTTDPGIIDLDSDRAFRSAVSRELAMGGCSPVHMEGVGRGLCTFAKPHQGVWGSVREGAEHVLLRRTRRPVPLGTASSSSCPPSRPFFAIALLPSPFPTMRPSNLPGGRAADTVIRRRVRGRWAGSRAKGTGALERHQLVLLARSRAASRAAHGPPRSILPRRARQQPARGNGGGQGDQKARSRAVGSSCSSWRGLGRRQPPAPTAPPRQAP